MFNTGTFTSHSGKTLSFKIECDDLTTDDLNTLAQIVGQRFKFGSVIGVPKGGLRFARALIPYCTTGPILVVDDVLTTGKSMEEYRVTENDVGVVIFARGPCPVWIHPIFTLTLPD